MLPWLCKSINFYCIATACFTLHYRFCLLDLTKYDGHYKACWLTPCALYANQVFIFFICYHISNGSFYRKNVTGTSGTHYPPLYQSIFIGLYIVSVKYN
jgi:hypothetical protein